MVNEHGNCTVKHAACACRFDLLHVMIDEPDEFNDERIANHIVSVHMRRESALQVPYTMGQVQNYIKYARTIKPELTPQVCLQCRLHATDSCTTTRLPVLLMLIIQP